MEQSLLKNRSFLLVWLSGLAIMLGFSMFFLSVSWYVVDVLQRPAVLGAVLMSVSIPRVIMMIYGGILADKIRKSFIMFTTNFLQVLVMVAMIILFLGGWLDVASLIIIALIFGFLDAFFFPAVSSMIPIIVRDEQLQRANSLFQGSTEMMFIIGPLIAGFLLTIGDFTLTFSAAAGLIAVSTVLIFPPFINDPRPKKRAGDPSALDDLKEGIAYVRHSHIHLSGTLSIVLLNLFIIGPILISFPILVGALGGTPFDLSLLEAGLSLGTFSASAAVVIWNVKRRRGQLVFASLLAAFGFFLIFSFLETMPLLIILAALTGLVAMFVYLPTVTIVQENTDKDKLGRVMSIITLAASGFEPIAFGLISFLVASGLAIQTVLTLSGAAGLILSICLIVFSPRFRKLD
ncbi:MFS transporter [Salisediminibacterium halotolerans]|uniref:Major Facilitator Superfamily protein n=1 Tax=Salisediminibacterium halotolerans TaxID=517425 RepID=A0A1H9VQZ1_9BACI|nr:MULTISPECIES: MFS transporter [Salisediminibacterium]RLJ80975.1 MFS transporter [Actinophytocola xinjiangensis]RPE83620.1 MFS transporter [Salisediminibacterium halotolerans]TWG37900.1 MFS transporter [Salisediminibacterium halotolerans]SES23894.1 Major Facilitator Superfamily protein [Salisediminibacterium haloalkalitolerans]GEL07032.1 MFS transporter [Salisediminibacterium halotolerans]